MYYYILYYSLSTVTFLQYGTLKYFYVQKFSDKNCIRKYHILPYLVLFLMYNSYLCVLYMKRKYDIFARQKQHLLRTVPYRSSADTNHSEPNIPNNCPDRFWSQISDSERENARNGSKLSTISTYVSMILVARISSIQNNLMYDKNLAWESSRLFRIRRTERGLLSSIESIACCKYCENIIFSGCPISGS